MDRAIALVVTIVALGANILSDDIYPMVRSFGHLGGALGGMERLLLVSAVDVLVLLLPM